MNNLQSYVEGTQRGYAYGVCNRQGVRFVERYVHVTGHGKGWKQEVDKAYSKASQGAASLLYTALHQRDLIRDWGPMPGKLEQR